MSEVTKSVEDLEARVGELRAEIATREEKCKVAEVEKHDKEAVYFKLAGEAERSGVDTARPKLVAAEKAYAKAQKEAIAQRAALLQAQEELGETERQLARAREQESAARMQELKERAGELADVLAEQIEAMVATMREYDLISRQSHSYNGSRPLRHATHVLDLVADKLYTGAGCRSPRLSKLARHEVANYEIRHSMGIGSETWTG